MTRSPPALVLLRLAAPVGPPVPAAAAAGPRGAVKKASGGGRAACDDDVPAEQCMELASQLSQNIDAALGLGDEADRPAFQSGTQAIGFPPCHTTTTSTTATTTTGTVATTTTGTVATTTT